MKTVITLLLVAASLLVSVPVEARAVRCEGCSPGEFYQKAIQLGPGKHVITSLSTGEMKGYEVLVEMEPGTHYGTYYVVERSLPDDYWKVFGVARDFYIATAGDMHARIFVDANDLNVTGLHNASIYDIMSDYSLRSRLGDRLYNAPLPFGEVRDEDGTRLTVNSAIARALEQIRKVAFAQLGISDGSIEIVVVTELGGYVVYRVSQDVGTGQYLEGRSRTPDGQPVPEDNAKEYAGTYLGDSADLYRFSRFMQDYHNASMGSTGSGTIMVSVTCSWNGETLHCVRKFSSTFPK